MSGLFCFGLSYTAAAYIERHGAQFSRIAGTVRNADKAEQIAKNGIAGRAVDAFAFDDMRAAKSLSDAALLIVSIPPDAHGDIALRDYSDRLRQTSALRSIIYLSTIGVYGDHAGAWVDETTMPNPKSARSRERLKAELQWQDFGRATGIPVAIFRLPGIYGPGRNALINVARGEARRIVKPGQVFNRIHVHDIAQAIKAAYIRRANGIFNICDDEPAPAQDPIAYAADLLGAVLPAEVAFDDIKPTLSPMALSFYAESKRVRNTRMKDELGVSLLYPSYREGLRALFEQGDAANLR
ncbi:MAG: SDR family oxidoreductase [Pseudorhodoplanes sp.]|jgi:nucleoside-diphosphate-sugar epimerase|nr:SDR family oxidoreductase [Pseudorhodoplanes sp.]